MASGNLSSAQFQPTVQVAEPRRPSQTSGETPLALGASTETSAQQASAWRKPNRVLPYSKATAGSTFKPYG